MPRESQHPSFTLAESDLPHLDKVPPPFITPVKLLHFEKMNYREIAADLRIPIGTVKSRIYRARDDPAAARRRAAAGRDVPGADDAGGGAFAVTPEHVQIAKVIGLTIVLCNIAWAVAWTCKR